jgi:peptidoglycan/xylan/chitin deacetylase (PgdA/CDA1 family)
VHSQDVRGRSLRSGPKRLTQRNASVGEALESPGRPLNSQELSGMRRFGEDFSDVRLHTDGLAAQSAIAVDAAAYTAGGRDIVFAPGLYRPGTPAGNRLLAHELAHVLQQRGSAFAPGLSVPGDRSEREARAFAAGIGQPSGDVMSITGTIARSQGRIPMMTSGAFSVAGVSLQRVQLTYDDGPDAAGNTQTVLHELNKAGARATFYLVGKKIAQGDNWRQVYDIAAGGHWIGNHAYDWNDAKDNHIFLSGSAEDRAQKILQTEWVIRDALIRGREDAKTKGTWDLLPAATRLYIKDVISSGTGRFRTPGFKSKIWNKEGSTTLTAISSANQVLAATGLKPLKITELDKWGPDYEGVTIDTKDWEAGKMQADIEKTVKDQLESNEASILLHSRLAASAGATPAIIAEIQKRKFTFDPTGQGVRGSVRPGTDFAGTSFSAVPTSSEITSAREFFRKNHKKLGSRVSGSVALGIFQLCQLAGPAEVDAFIAEIKGMTIETEEGPTLIANWMMKNPEWRLFTSFLEAWKLQKPFPRVKGVTIQ